MNLSELVERFGENPTLITGGLLLGVLFGAAALRSAFCLRAAVLELGERRPGEKLAIWLLTFGVALTLAQLLIAVGWLDVSNSRMFSTPGSISGAILGGLLFGSGMVLTRGCATRLLVLSATGNLRALLSCGVFAVVSQASLEGVLSPWRLEISRWWMVSPDYRDLGHTLLHGHVWLAVIFGLLWLCMGIWMSRRERLSGWVWSSAVLVGASVALAWSFTYLLSRNSFEVVAIKSFSFSGPMADSLMWVISATKSFNFDIGLLTGVFIGALAVALFTGKWKLDGFRNGYAMRRYLVGALLMGFGAMLAGGCAVGAGVSGGAVLSLTGWLTLFCIWMSALATHHVVDRRRWLRFLLP